MTRSEYAFGADEVEDCNCPAVAAGFDTTHGTVSRVSGRFDELARSDDVYAGEDEAVGTVDAKTAEKLWCDVVEHCERFESDRAEKVARSVADLLGWGQ